MMMCPPFSFLLILVHHNHFGSTSAICSFIMFCSFLFFPPPAAGCNLSSGVFRCEQRLWSQEEARLGCRHDAFFSLFCTYICMIWISLFVYPGVGWRGSRTRSMCYIRS